MDSNMVKPYNKNKEILIAICEELLSKNIIVRFLEGKNNFRIAVNVDAGKKSYLHLWKKFEELGFEVQMGDYAGALRVYYIDKQNEIDNVFAKYLN